MHVSRFAREVESYIAATRDIRLNEHCAFEAFTAFSCDALLLIRDRWPDDAPKWIEAIREARTGVLSESDCLALQRSLATYRSEALGEPGGMDTDHGDESALVFLIQLAIEIPPKADSMNYRGTALAGLIDEFAVEFIEHFGMGDAVLRLIKLHFVP